VLLNRARVDQEVLEVVVLPVVLGSRLREGCAQGSHRVVGAFAAVVERRAEQLELFAQRTDADPQHQPSAADAVERPVTLGDSQRVVVAEHQYVRGEPNRRRVRAEGTERCKGVVVPAPARLGDVDRHADMFAARAVVIAEPLGRLHDRHDIVERPLRFPLRVRARKLGEHRRDDAEFHTRG
jgi:hypothetical protein